MFENYLKLYRSSTVGVGGKNFKLLCDPWLEDGEYYGAWSHYPPYNLKKNKDEINSYDAIYISHIHPDHCSEKTLLKISKKIPIFIHSYQSKFLKFKLERIGFKVFELKNNEEKFFNKDFSIRIIAADNCDPQLCYKFTGCALNQEEKNDSSQQIDSLAIIKVNKKIILNLNDCPFDLAKNLLKKISKEYTVDLMLVGYGGAGPYPQCFENLNYKQKTLEAKSKKTKFLEFSKKIIDTVRPKYYLPFAGTYYLSGKLSKLQKLRGVPSIEEASVFLEKSTNNSTCIRLNNDDYLNLENFESSKKYRAVTNKEIDNYISKTLSKRKMDYENEINININEIYNLAEKAFERYLNNINKYRLKLSSNILIKLEDEYIFIDNFKKKLNFIGQKEIQHIDNYVLHDLDPRLLFRILKGPKFGHWNNAEIGSHIKYFRKPNVFNRNLHFALCYFHS